MPRGRPFRPGQSGNPSGRPKVREEFKEECLKLLNEKVIEAWRDELEIRQREVITPAGPMDITDRGKNWVRVSELVAAYAIGKPVQTVEKTVTHVRKQPREMSLEEIEQRRKELLDELRSVAH